MTNRKPLAGPIDGWTWDLQQERDHEILQAYYDAEHGGPSIAPDIDVLGAIRRHVCAERHGPPTGCACVKITCGSDTCMSAEHLEWANSDCCSRVH